MRRKSWRAVPLALGICTAVGCGHPGASRETQDSGATRPVEGGTRDGATMDAAVTDGSFDSEGDGSRDASVDAGDAAEDSSGDVSTDAREDASADATPADATPDSPGDSARPPAEAGTDASQTSTVRIGMNPGEGCTASDIATWTGYMQQLRVTAVRLFFPIYTWAPSGPDDAAHYYWPDNVTEIQDEIEGYSAQGFRVTVTMAAGPCSSTQVCPAFPQPTGMTRADGSAANQFDSFLQTFVSAIGMSTFRKISAVEVWNEWDNAGNGSPYGYLNANGNGWSRYTASQVVDTLLHAGYVTLKGYNPSVEIIAGAVITGSEGDIAALASAGGGQWADAFSYHPYYSSTANLSSGLTKAKSGVPAGKALTLTEWGCNPGSFNAPATSGSAAVLTASFPVLRAAGIEEADYYVMNSSEYSTANQATYGLVSATLTGGGPNLVVSNAAPQAPLFAAFQTGAQ